VESCSLVSQSGPWVTTRDLVIYTVVCTYVYTRYATLFIRFSPLPPPPSPLDYILIFQYHFLIPKKIYQRILSLLLLFSSHLLEKITNTVFFWKMMMMSLLCTYLPRYEMMFLGLISQVDRALVR
jgi:hypothetical protein